MIAVIADDLTGAAELAGVGLRYGLGVKVVTEVDPGTSAELLVVSADTRSLKRDEAVAKIRQITRKLIPMHPRFIYKKTDSVLRGYVVAELLAQMEEMNIRQALLVPSNPELGRTIVNGQCLYQDRPIHLSSFAGDPEFPVKSSFIHDMLGTTGISVLKPGAPLRGNGISVGEVCTIGDLQDWAGMIEDDVVLAGAAAFFTVLLDRLYTGKISGDSEASERGMPTLFVCGTTFLNSREAIRHVKDNGGPVSYMPDQASAGLGSSGAAIKDWCHEIISLLLSHGKAIIAINEHTTVWDRNATDLRAQTAEIVEMVLREVKVSELVVEGGSTAAAIIRQLNFSTLTPVLELSAGVIRMRVDGTEGLYLTIKPGSYPWPEGLWTF